MTQYHPICYQIHPHRTTQENINQSDTRKRLLDTQDSLIKSICGLGNNLTLSLRYYYHPQHSPKLKTYLLIKSSPECQTTGVYGQIANQLTKGPISNYFQFTHQPNFTQAQNLNWVKVIGEIIKYEQIIPTKNYYLPHLLDPNPANDMSVVYDVINKLDHQLILEITLQTYQNDQEKSTWLNAINQMIEQLNQVNDQDSTALNLYQQYQQQFSHGILAKYSIKALAENIHDEKLILDTLGDIATKKDNYQRQYQIISTHQGESTFTHSLTATENVDIFTGIEWEGWSNYQDLWIQPIKNVIKPQNKPKSNDPLANLAGLFDDGSLALPSVTPSSSAIVASSGSLLAKLATAKNSVNVARMIDLKPLHRLVTLQEISGFFRLAVPEITSNQTTQISEEFTNGFDIKYLINKYGKSITETTYIAGIDQAGQLCVSDFSKIPHRIIGGTTGSGKTNFINSVIYQFLYGDRSREIYIIDFQAGLHYQLIVDQQPTVKMVTQLEDTATLMGKLWTEHENRRQIMLEKRVRNLQDLREKHGIKRTRILVIIDEAFYIKTAERTLKNTIETHLNNLAAQSRVSGIHLVYCTQTPTSEVIDTQTSNNMGEKVLFKIESRTDSIRLLGEDTAASLPFEPKGRAIYKGIDGTPKLIATPKVPDEIWEDQMM